MSTTKARQHVYDLIDQLAPSQLAAVKELLSVMLHPIAYAVHNAPIDDEDLTEEEAASLRRSEEWFRHNEGIPMEEVLAEFGLSMKDFPIEKRGD